mgnify:CR=1 FL=1
MWFRLIAPLPFDSATWRQWPSSGRHVRYRMSSDIIERMMQKEVVTCSDLIGMLGSPNRSSYPPESKHFDGEGFMQYPLGSRPGLFGGNQYYLLLTFDHECLLVSCQIHPE